MANFFRRLSRAPVTKAIGAILVLTTLSACVGPHHRHYGGGPGYGRSYANYQPAYRGGYNGGGYQRGGWR